ncbi:MAG: group 1 glycosyl transferase [Parcubacteria group bacterium Gr01-1014_31]|nr:MAG: group 1 glycosyl transferase [Parcubacteria group bacterium Gr01-1014_31]
MSRTRRPRIAIIAPFFLPIPPRRQGGTEWIVAHQADGLVDRGYPVTLLAVAGSTTRARLIPVITRGVSDYPLRLDSMEASRKLRLEMTALGLAAEHLRQNRFDLVFNHARGGELLYPLLRQMGVPMVTVLHLPVFSENAKFLAGQRAPLVSISNHERRAFPRLNYVATVYNGVNTKTFSFNAKPRDYLLMMTTIGEHKNTLDGIVAAKRARRKLIIAGKIRDHAYFAAKIKPRLDGRTVRYLGEVGLKEKIRLYRNASALLFPVVWEEPFGLVMIESLSCGTPVVGYRSGAVPEVIRHGITGFITPKTPAALAQAIRRLPEIDRAACRHDAVRRFSLDRMLDGYEKVIHHLI